MRRLTFCIVLSSLIFASACVEDVLIEVEPAESKIVISSFFIPDNILVVTATRSFSALSAKSLESLENDLISTLLVDQALVTVTSNQVTDTLSQISPGIFIGTLSDPKTLDFFELNIYDSVSLSSVRSVTQLEQQVRFDSVSVNLNIEDGDTTSLLYYQFLDPSDQENWYLVQGFEAPRLPELNNIDFNVEDGEVVVDTTESNQVFFEQEVELLFSDLISDLTLENDSIYRTKDLPFVVSDTAIFIVMNIDEGYYDFLQARKRSGNVFASLLREPVNHPTNVENGYGYFTMHTPDFKAFVRKED